MIAAAPNTSTSLELEWSPRNRFASRSPAQFSLAHGGKDRHPYPMPIKVYDEAIRVLKLAVHREQTANEFQIACRKLGKKYPPSRVLRAAIRQFPIRKVPAQVG